MTTFPWHKNGIRILSLAGLLAVCGLLPRVASAAVPDVIIDNTNGTLVTQSGTWVASTAAGYYGSNAIHDDNKLKGSKSVTFQLDVPETGSYEVYMWWVAASNRADNVPVAITDALGTDNFQINQKTNGSKWVYVGTYKLSSTSPGTLVISNASTNGYVSADAVKLVQVPPEDGLVSRWKLDETSGTVAEDARGLQDGSLNGSASWVYPGKHHGGVRFDGTQGFISVPDRPEYDGSQLSITAWFCPEALDGQSRGIVSKRLGPSNGSAFSVLLSGSSNFLTVDIGNDRYVTNHAITDAYAWHHVAVVFDGSLSSNRLKVYVNGEATPVYQAQPTVSAIPDTSAPITIGALDSSASESFIGRIDEVQIYERALEPLDIAQIYSFGFSSFKIPLNPEMLLNEAAAGDPSGLVDEQSLAGDPVNGSGGAPLTKVAMDSSISGSWYSPMNIIVDLGAVHDLTHIAFYDGSNAANITFSSGSPFNWTPIFSHGQNHYMTWVVTPVNVQTRYVQISLASPGVSPHEILFYGSPHGVAEPPPEPPQYLAPRFEEFLGINVFPKEPLHRQEVVTNIREWHSWSYNEGHGSSSYSGYPNNENAFAPAWTGRDYDEYFRRLRTLKLEPIPCIQSSVSWLTPSDINHKPILAGSGRDPLDPASYIEHADHMFQLAARYGSTAVDDSLLKLKSDQPRLSGMGLLRYIEDWNEQNKWWKGRDSYFTPYEYAAMGSADVDGHMGTMGSTVGMRNADPNMLFVMGGMARADVDYIKAMKLWCDHFRGGDFPWNVINVHFYCNDGGGQYAGTVGVSPEEGLLKERMEPIARFRDMYLHDVELWVSEFGYDTDPGSPQRAPAIGTFSAEEVQAQWLVRSYLALAAAGVDRAFAYALGDDFGGSGRYGTSGLLTTEWTNYQPKVSWWYVYTLKNRLKGLRFDAEQDSGNPNVRIYRFKNDDGVVKAYVLWCPTSNQTTVSNYSLSIQGTPTTVSLVTMQEGDPDGIKTPLTPSGSSVLVNVSECPVFVLLDAPEADFELTELLELDPSMVTLEYGGGDPTRLVDEQSSVGDPREPNGGGAPTTVWSTSGSASAYIDLGERYFVDRIYLRDMNNIGDMVIEAGTPGNWTPLSVDPLKYYNSWNQHPVRVKTRYLRFTKTTGAANVSEIAVYGKIPPFEVEAEPVFTQKFDSSASVSSYVDSSSPGSGQFNDISAEIYGGTWSIQGGRLQIVRSGSGGGSNGAGFTRWTNLPGPPSVMWIRFDMQAAFNSSQNDAFSLAFLSASAFQDYNAWPPSNNVFGTLNVDGAGSNTLRFEISGTSSAQFPADGTLHRVALALNKSGSTKTYNGPDGSVHTLNHAAMSLWVNDVLALDNIPVSNGVNSSLADIRGRFAYAGTGTWAFDNFEIYDVLP